MYFEHVLFFSQCISFIILANLFNGVKGDLFGKNRWDGGGFSALFNSWQIKPDVKQSQGDQLFGRLPQNPESSYTPVSCNRRLLVLNFINVHLYLKAGSHPQSGLPSTNSTRDDRRWVSYNFSG